MALYHHRRQRKATLLGLIIFLSSCISCCLAAIPKPRNALPDFSGYLDENYAAVAKRQGSSLAGYLGVFFLGADPYVYFYLSNGNEALSFKALNRGQPITRPTKGTGGVRDPTIIPGGGAEAGKKWYIIGTDLHIGKVSQFMTLV